MTKASKTTPCIKYLENSTPKGYSRLKEAHGFRHTIFRPPSVETSLPANAVIIFLAWNNGIELCSERVGPSSPIFRQVNLLERLNTIAVQVPHALIWVVLPLILIPLTALGLVQSTAERTVRVGNSEG